MAIDSATKWRRRFWILVALFVCWNIALSSDTVRGLLISPLVRHDSDARGDIAYVMADGAAYWERLLSASDLYHMHRVDKIFLLREDRNSCYNFIRKKNDTLTERAVDYLEMRGVPSDAIHFVPPAQATWLSSRDEAIALANLDKEFGKIIVVTSPPHTRRSLLTFQRVFADQSLISIHSAAPPSQSVETHLPIWIEYVKLIVYWFAV
ncbi:YdcF family protein [Stieleria sp. JC731]|uniref:YdcF family protein n=1 Tax=Pirellulaceae TaxID=2691357 RepID=UPI001E43266D|nr:YdcF family protein [Stieleria sp. JC731]MCC9601429.1 YdcF family protein [Stieleria sp. JC731]